MAGEMTHQERVDRIIMLKALSDTFKDMFEKERKAYTDEELERTAMPRGDESELGNIVAAYSKAETVTEFEVVDPELLAEDLKADEDAREWFRATWWPAHKAQFAREWFEESGAVLEGCELRTQRTRKEFKYFTVRPTSESKQAVRDWVTSGTKGILGDGDDD